MRVDLGLTVKVGSSAAAVEDSAAVELELSSAAQAPLAKAAAAHAMVACVNFIVNVVRKDGDKEVFLVFGRTRSRKLYASER